MLVHRIIELLTSFIDTLVELITSFLSVFAEAHATVCLVATEQVVSVAVHNFAKVFACLLVCGKQLCFSVLHLGASKMSEGRKAAEETKSVFSGIGVRTVHMCPILGTNTEYRR